jgi:hypothetical protein
MNMKSGKKMGYLKKKKGRERGGYFEEKDIEESVGATEKGI